jgi:hypothetical protein
MIIIIIIIIIIIGCRWLPPSSPRVGALLGVP